MDGRMVGKPMKERNRLQMLEEQQLWRTAKDRSVWRESMWKKLAKTCDTANN